MRLKYKRKLLFLIIFSLICITVLNAITRYLPIIQSRNDVDRKLEETGTDEFVPDEENLLACKQPNLHVFSPEMMKFIHDVSPVDCLKAGKDWVKCKGSECKIQEEIYNTYGSVKCIFTDVIRVNDFKSTYGDSITSDSYKLARSDVVRVSCKSQENYNWSATLTGIRQDSRIWNRAGWSKLSVTAAKLNVLIFGFDSLSRNAFIRKLPRSYRYLTKVLEGHVLKGYNILGDGTSQALIPMLTGKLEVDLPDTRKRFPNTTFVNVYPFVWNDFQEAGYVTGFFEDVSEGGIFSQRHNGFKETPTDHYMRTYYLASLGERHKWPRLCTGEIPRHKVMMDQIKNFFAVYPTKPKFLFAFHGELSHNNYNLVEVADDDLYNFLKDLHESGILENTLLILMADHGNRSPRIRGTVQGKQEERLPFFSFTFPSTFKNRFTKAYENFRNNINKLTTPLDIYTTLKSILNLHMVGEADIRHRSVSLFTRITDERSCNHAGIEPHWCTCLDLQSINPASPLVERIVEALLLELNSYTEFYRNLCEPLKLSHIEWVTKMSPNENLIKFKRSADMDGLVPDMTAKMQINTNTYQIKVVLVPGQSIFEATVTYAIDQDKFYVRMSDISRLNTYGRQARCVEKFLPHLKKYCYCRT